MIEFKNRQSTNTNRRRLVVKSVTRNSNDELTELVVDVYRGDTNVVEAGTQLNATDLNKILNAINSSLNFLYQEYYTAENNLTVTWTQIEGELQSKTFKIYTTQKFYAKVIVTGPYIELGFVDNSRSDYIEFEIKETQALNNTTGTSTRTFNFTVELYLDSNFTQYLTKLTGTVNYINTSTYPSD